MADKSLKILTEHLSTQRQNMEIYQEYHNIPPRPYIKSLLTLLIEDTYEAIAKTASRMRQLDGSPGRHGLDDSTRSKIRQAHRQRTEEEKLKFVRQRLNQHLQWCGDQINALVDDADTQALLVALAEQTRTRLNRWETLMEEMKVSPDK